jgi:hypothetical protein
MKVLELQRGFLGSFPRTHLRVVWRARDPSVAGYTEENFIPPTLQDTHRWLKDYTDDFSAIEDVQLGRRRV